MSIYNCKGIPIYADIAKETMSLTLESIKRSVRDDTKAVMIVHVGGVVTNVWKVEDRLLMLSVRRYETKDCCTDQLLEFSCCTLLIQPITNKKK